MPLIEKRRQGRGNDSFRVCVCVGGGKNVVMPSYCQNLGGGGTGMPIPLRQKLGGELPPCPPGSRAPERMGLSPGGRFPPSFIHQVILITGLNKL